MHTLTAGKNPRSIRAFVCLSIIVLLTAGLIATVTAATTYIDDDISENMTWDPAGSPYVIGKTIYVESGYTLTIDPGTTILFNSTGELVINGTIDAQGTSGSPITFTANNGAPFNGNWTGIRLEKGAIDCTFDHCEILWATVGLNSSTQNHVNVSNTHIKRCLDAGFVANGSQVTLTDCNISLNYNNTATFGVTSSGARCYDSNVYFETCEFWSNNETSTTNWPWTNAIVASTDSYVRLFNSTVTDHTVNSWGLGLRIDDESRFNASWSLIKNAGTAVGMENSYFQAYKSEFSNSTSWSANIMGENATVRLNDCKIINSTAVGVYLYFGSDLSMQDCNITNNSQTSVEVRDSDAIVHTSLMGYSWYGLRATNTNVTLVGSNMTQNTNRGCEISYTNNDAHGATIVNNMFVNNSYDRTTSNHAFGGLYVSENQFPNIPAQVLIQDNKVWGNNGTGIYLSAVDPIMIDNQIIGSGAFIDSPTASATNVVSGVYCTNRANPQMEANIIGRNIVGVSSFSASHPKLTNSTITNSVLHDVYFWTSSEASMLNTAYTLAKVNFTDSTSYLHELDYSEARVRNGGGTDIVGTIVKVQDVNENILARATTDGSGIAWWIPFVNTTYYDGDGDFISTGETISSNPHNYSVMDLGQSVWGFNVTTMDHREQVNITVGAVPASWLFWDRGKTVVGDETFTDNVIFCSGDIYVPADTNLTLDGCALYMLCDSNGQYRIQVNDSGQLNTDNSIIDKGGAGNYNFILQGTSNEGARAFINDTYLSGMHRDGLQILDSSKVFITNNTFHDLEYEAMLISGSSPWIYGNNISRASQAETTGYAVEIVNSGINAHPVLSYNEFYNNQRYNIYLGMSASITSSYNLIQMGEYGIYGTTSTTIHSDNDTVSYTTNRGIYGTNSVSMRVVDGNFYHNKHAVYFQSTFGLIARNDLQYNYNGTFITSCTLSRTRILNNTISNNHNYGIYMSNSWVKVAGNTVNANGGQSGNARWCGIYNSFSCWDVEISHNTIANNPWTGLYSEASSGVMSIHHNTVNNNGFRDTNNYIHHAGICLYYDCDYRLWNNTISNNPIGLTYYTFADHYYYCYNSTFTSNSNIDMCVFDSLVAFVNCSHSSVYAQLQSAANVVEVKIQNYLDVYVAKNDAPAVGANVQVQDNLVPVLNVPTGADGWATWLPVTYQFYTVATATQWTRTPTVNVTDVVATYPSFSQTKAVTMNTHKELMFGNSQPYADPVPFTVQVAEDSRDDFALDLSDYFYQDMNVTGDLTFQVLSNNQSSIVDVGINFDGRNLTVDSMNGAANDHWFGWVGVVINGSDALGNWVHTDVIDIEIYSVNDVPTWTTIAPQFVDEDSSNSTLVFLPDHTNDDDGDDLEYTVVSWTNNTLMDVFVDDEGWLGYAPTSISEDFVGDVRIQLVVYDGTEYVYTNMLIVFEPANDAPRISKNLYPVSMMEDTSDSSIDLSKHFEDPEDDPLAYDYVLNDNVTIIVGSDGAVHLTPIADWNGFTTLWFSCSDGTLETFISCGLTVVPTDDAPTLAVPATIMVTEGQLKKITINMADDKDGENVTLITDIGTVIPGLSLGSTLKVDAVAHTIELLCDDEQVGSYKVTITAEDEAGTQVSKETTIQVLNVNEPPSELTIIRPNDGAMLRSDTPVNFEARCIDPDTVHGSTVERLVFSWSLDMDSVIGIGNPIEGILLTPGVHNITVEVSDIDSNALTATIQVTVKDATTDTDDDGVPDMDDPDDDNDGMPDTYETAHGLDPLVNDSASDLDGDTFSNIDEYNAGTDPDDISSKPQITTDGTSGNETNGTDGGGEETDYTMAFIIIPIAVLVLILVVAALVIVMVRKKAQDSAEPEPEPIEEKPKRASKKKAPEPEPMPEPMPVDLPMPTEAEPLPNEELEALPEAQEPMPHEAEPMPEEVPVEGGEEMAEEMPESEGMPEEAVEGAEEMPEEATEVQEETAEGMPEESVDPMPNEEQPNP